MKLLLARQALARLPAPLSVEDVFKALGAVLVGFLLCVAALVVAIGTLLHAVTNPVVYDQSLTATSEKARPVLEALRTVNAEGDFRSPAALLDESLVRALSLRYKYPNATPEERALLEGNMLKEYRSGYVLERYFWEHLADYEKTTETLRQYYPVMLDSLNVLNEIRRWQADVALNPAGAAPESTGRGAR